MGTKVTLSPCISTGLQINSSPVIVSLTIHTDGLPYTSKLTLLATKLSITSNSFTIKFPFCCSNNFNMVIGLLYL